MQISLVLVMIKPVYGHFTLILQKEKWYIKTFCYKIFENHLYTKFGKKKIIILKTTNILVIQKNLLFLPMHVHSCLFFFFLKKLSPDVLYQGNSIAYE